MKTPTAGILLLGKDRPQRGAAGEAVGEESLWELHVDASRLGWGEGEVACSGRGGAPAEEEPCEEDAGEPREENVTGLMMFPVRGWRRVK